MNDQIIVNTSTGTGTMKKEDVITKTLDKDLNDVVKNEDIRLNLTRTDDTSTDLIKVGVDSASNEEIKSRASKRPSEFDEDWAKRTAFDSSVTEPDLPFQRRKCRKYAILLSYCGKGYYGMQRNPGTKTIEDQLLLSMYKASLIKEEGIKTPQMYRFQRAARTDKGVSAARQIISMKLPDDVDLPAVINEHLPEQIHVMKAVRVTQKFDAKLQCDARSYSYLTPSFAFAPSSQETNDDYRISLETLNELRGILDLYKGTHNFHNFTARVKYSDGNANRYIIDFTSSDPFMREGIEWILIKVKGQSFMLHQIRKMIGLAMAICRRLTSNEVFKKVWKEKRVDIPIAPGLGLVLEEPHYDWYNKKYSKDGIHEVLNWDSEAEKIENFREKFINSEIINTEIDEKCTLQWLTTLPLHTFDYREEGINDKIKKSGPDLSSDVDSSSNGDHSNSTEMSDDLKSSES